MSCVEFDLDCSVQEWYRLNSVRVNSELWMGTGGGGGLRGRGGYRGDEVNFLPEKGP